MVIDDFIFIMMMILLAVSSSLFYWNIYNNVNVNSQWTDNININDKVLEKDSLISDDQVLIDITVTNSLLEKMKNKYTYVLLYDENNKPLCYYIPEGFRLPESNDSDSYFNLLLENKGLNITSTCS